MKTRLLGCLMGMALHSAVMAQGLAQNLAQTLAPVLAQGGGSGPGGPPNPNPTPPATGAATSNPVIWAVGLFAVALLLFAVELMLPTGGLVFLVSLVLTIMAIVALFQVSPEYGLIGIAVTLASLPFLFAAAIKVLPDTPVFRLMTLKDRGPDGTEPAGRSSDEWDDAGSSRVGMEAEVVSTLRPSGMVRVDGQRVDAISLVGEIKVGERVVVVSQDGFGLRVRRVAADRPTSDRGDE